MKFTHLMNNSVLILTPLFGEGQKLLKATVVDVDPDAQGLWVEAQELTCSLLEDPEDAGSRALLFLPFHQIRLAVAQLA
jgi:hypothetical protein